MVQDDQGNRHSTQAMWDGKAWKREWLTPALEDLQTCQFQRFRDNFVRVNATPGNLAWDDDEGWVALVEKARHCAWLTKRGGCKGLAIDFESYGAAQFRYDPAQGGTAVDNHWYEIVSNVPQDRANRLVAEQILRDLRK